MEEAGSGAFKPLTTIDAIQVATEISSALQYLHSQSICHRDVKPGNILVSYTDRFVLSDFGSARRTRGLIRESPATLAFACPEATIESTGFFDALKADLWALGLVVWCCLFNRFPFEITDDPLTQIKNIQSWDFASDSRISTLDEEKRAVVAALLTRDPISRRYWPS
jgi:[calcium/calmodulin-dependent protein kinase] kinase